MIATPTKHKFTVESLTLIEKAGVFHPQQRIELINGEIIDMSPINPPHANCVRKLIRFFQQHLSLSNYILDLQNPVQLNEYSLPQPDVVIARYRPKLLESAHIQGQDVALLIEVSDTSYQYDRNIKLPLYATVGIPLYWIVNLDQRQVEVYSEPQENSYKKVTIHTQGSFEALGLTISTNDILPQTQR